MTDFGVGVIVGVVVTLVVSVTVSMLLVELFGGFEEPEEGVDGNG